MSMKMEKKTFIIILGIIACLLVALFFVFDILKPALDPVVNDMVKIFLCGAGCGLLAGIWLGRKFEKDFGKKDL